MISHIINAAYSESISVNLASFVFACTILPHICQLRNTYFSQKLHLHYITITQCFDSGRKTIPGARRQAKNAESG